MPYVPYKGELKNYAIRRQLGKEVIFRVRTGNGYYGSQIGKKYQDRYDYVVPSSINNPEGQTARYALTLGVFLWQAVLTPSQKAEYNRRAIIKMHMSGYNLYLSEYIKTWV